MLPGQTMRSTLGTVAVPNAKAAMACAPPMRNRRGMFRNRQVARISGLGCGDATQMVWTPATWAGITVINSVDGSGERPAGGEAPQGFHRRTVRPQPRAPRDVLPRFLGSVLFG